MMKIRFSFPVLLLTACVAQGTAPVVGEGAPQGTTADKLMPEKPRMLFDRVQSDIAAAEGEAIAALPSVIEEFTASGPVADRESNQRGAGFTRVYTDESGEIVVTVFIYNNQDLGLTDDITPAAEALLDRHLQEIKQMESSGLYSDVKIGDRRAPRELRWRREKFRIIEGDAQFVQNDERKMTVVMLASDKRLMSYVRVRFTYPRETRWKIEEKKGRFMATVLYALREITKVPQ